MAPGRLSRGRRSLLAEMADPTNTEIAAALDELGDLYELDGAIIHRDRRLPQRRQGGARRVGLGHARSPREGRATELPGIGATIQEKVLALADDGRDPGGGEAARQVPARPGRDDAAARARPQARAAAVRGARDRLARGAARRRPTDAADPRAQGLRSEGRGGARSRRSHAPTRGGDRRDADRAGPRARGRRAAGRRRCARTRRPSGSSSPARRGG